MPAVRPAYNLQNSLDGKSSEGRSKYLWRGRRELNEQAKAKLQQFSDWGYGKLAGVHREDAVFLYRRSENAWRADAAGHCM